LKEQSDQLDVRDNMTREWFSVRHW
jgi:hypothetical protein